MNLREIISLLQARVLAGDGLLDAIEVEHCFSADLMSDVLGRTHANGILVTGLTNPQAVRTADIADIKAVCVVRGKQPETDTVALATQKDIPLFVTKLSMFEACGILYQNGLRGVAERQ
jgi:predicted transcriptional regulator